jgi:peptidoglycan/LPS O-acetylase OafA/YrhL
MDGLVLGSLAAVIARREAWARILRSASAAILLACAGIVLATFALDRSTVYDAYFRSWGSSALATIFAIWVFRASSGQKSWLSWKPLRAIGKRAYGLYLIHAPISQALKPHVRNLHLNLLWILAYSVAMFCLCYALAWLSFRYFETPINKYKRHFRYQH